MNTFTTIRVLGLSALSLSVLSCGDAKKPDEKSETQGLTYSDPCELELKGQCGAACADNTACGPGQHCTADKTCGAVCTAEGAQCRGTCTPTGECDGVLVPTVKIPPPNNDGPLIEGDETTDGSKCIEVVSGFEGATPSVLVLVDRSGSMDEPFDGPRDRWVTVRDSLTNPNDGIIKRLEGSVRFGLSLYTATNPGDDQTVFDECPTLVTTPIGLNNYSAINTTYAATQLIPKPGGGHQGQTPTAESVKAAAATLAAYSEPGPKAIVLATDGNPDNCMNGADHGDFSKEGSVQAVTDALASGIKTFVISVGNETSADHLKDLAVAGQGRPDAEPYSALTLDQLEAAFSQILGGVRSCSFALNGKVPDFHSANGKVTVGGESLTFGDPDGWAINADGTGVEILGAACQKVLSGSGVVNISFPCVPEFRLPL